MTDPVTPIDAIGRYRGDHPIVGEATRFTLMGWPPGTSVRRIRALWVIAAIAVVAAFVVPARIDVPFLVGAVFGVVGVALVAGLVAVVFGRVRGGSTSVAVVLTTERLLTAEGRPDTTVDEDTDVEVTWVKLDSLTSMWLRGQQVSVLSLGGPAGPIVTVEMGTLDRQALDVNLAEAGLVRLDHHP